MVRLRCLGFTTVEVSVVTGIVGILTALGLGMLDMEGLALTSVQEDLRGSIQHALILAHAQGRNVTVALGEEKQVDILPVTLPTKVKWGKPDTIPLPKGVPEPKVATQTGQAHARITVSPGHTATASLWFLNDGRDALCMRLSDRGHLQLLRWNHRERRWRLL